MASARSDGDHRPPAARQIRVRPEERSLGCNLGLYSMTFNNDVDRDMASAGVQGIPSRGGSQGDALGFLNVRSEHPRHGDLTRSGRAVNDAIVRSLAGDRRGRPLFLKMVYHGPKFMEEMVSYDPRSSSAF